MKKISESLKKFELMKIDQIRKEIKSGLYKVTGCDIQHNGWACNKCFFSINKNLTIQDWQSVLALRGDYPKDELPELPKVKEDYIYHLAKVNKILISKIKK